MKKKQKPLVERLSYQKVIALHADALQERNDWEPVWRGVSALLIPGRGIHQTYKRPQRRKLTTNKVIDDAGGEALNVLASEVHTRLTSPSRQWFTLSWEDDRIKKVEPLKQWLQNATDTMHHAFHVSDFYSSIHSHYIEHFGFNTAAIYVGEDSDDGAPFRFEVLTVGEYCFTLDSTGKVNGFFRTSILSARQMVERFGDKVSAKLQNRVKKNKTGIDVRDITILEFVTKDKYMGKPFVRVIYELSGDAVSTHPDRGVTDGTDGGDMQKPLEVRGFHEMPYLVSRCEVIGSDLYGVGPGIRSLNHVKRLQEMQKSFLMGVHRDVDPPLNVPANLRKKLNRMPGGVNFYSNPQMVVSEMISGKPSFQGIKLGIEDVVGHIQKIFFNDIFLTATRDPNASPLKARQVDAQEMEKMSRLGNIVERLQHELLKPLIERCFNICMRKGRFDELSPDLAEMAGDFKITLTSPLATAQRGVALQGINAFLGFVGQASQFDQTAMDNIDVDATVREIADITGVHLGVLRGENEVKKMRSERAKQQAQEAKAKQQAEVAQVQNSMDVEAASAAESQANAGLALAESQNIQQDMSLF